MVRQRRTAKSCRPESRLLKAGKNEAETQSQKNSRDQPLPLLAATASTSLHLGRVAIARINVYFLHLALLVGQLEQIPIRVHSFYFQLVEFPIGGGRRRKSPRKMGGQKTTHRVT